MRPGSPAVCFGTVMHHRVAPTEHRFTYPVTQVWLDPDDPGAVCDNHPLWSATRPAPVRFRRTDYLDRSDAPLGPAVRHHLTEVLGREPEGPLRMLTQLRTWGWLFNPITVYLAWDDDATDPVAALLEVTNTPWKERHLYPVTLQATGPPSAPDATPDGSAGPGNGTGRHHGAAFPKALHVSPFLGLAYHYRLDVHTEEHPGRPRRLTLQLDVIDQSGPVTAEPETSACIRDGPGTEPRGISPDSQLVLTTRLVIDQHPVERAMLTEALQRTPLPTHRVSFGIHHQALRLWRAGVPFVAHPRRARRAVPADTL